MIDESLHAHGTHVEHVTGNAGCSPRGLGGATTNAALAAEAWDGSEGREVQFRIWGDGATGRGHGALTGEAAEGVEGRPGRRVASFAVVGEAGDVGSGSGEVEAFFREFGDGDWDCGAGACEAFTWHWAGTAFGDAD